MIKLTMDYQILKIPFLLLILFFGDSQLHAQDIAESNGAYYKGEVFSYFMNAPDSWRVDLENAENDGQTAAFFPADENYFEYTTKIRIGIFKNGKRKFSEFISADSSYLLKKTENLEIIRSDTVFYSSGSHAIIFETEDPGGEYELAMLAYIDAVTETVVYELLISSREYFGEGETRFREVLDRFEVVKH